MKASELMSYKNWIVIGDVENSSKYAYKILKSLEMAGFNVTGFNPRNKNDSLKDIKNIEGNIEVLDLCINPKDGIKILESAAEIGINKILIQPGAESDEILNFCENKGMIAIEGCALVELNNLT